MVRTKTMHLMGAMMRLMQHNIYKALRSLPGTSSTHHKWQQYHDGPIPILPYLNSIPVSFQAFFWAKVIQEYFMLVGGKDLASSILSLCKHLDFTHALMIMLTSLLVNFLSLAAIVQSLSHVQLCASPWTAALQASLSITVSQSLLKLMSIESMMIFDHLILCSPLLLLPSIFTSIRVFTSQSGSSHQVAKVLELQQQFFQWLFRIDIL